CSLSICSIVRLPSCVVILALARAAMVSSCITKSMALRSDPKCRAWPSQSGAACEISSAGIQCASAGRSSFTIGLVLSVAWIRRPVRLRLASQAGCSTHQATVAENSRGIPLGLAPGIALAWGDVAHFLLQIFLRPFWRPYFSLVATHWPRLARLGKPPRFLCVPVQSLKISLFRAEHKTLLDRRVVSF